MINRVLPTVPRMRLSCILWEEKVHRAKALQYDLPDLPQYHLPELRGRRGKQRDKVEIHVILPGNVFHVADLGEQIINFTKISIIDNS